MGTTTVGGCVADGGAEAICVRWTLLLRGKRSGAVGELSQWEWSEPLDRDAECFGRILDGVKPVEDEALAVVVFDAGVRDPGASSTVLVARRVRRVLDEDCPRSEVV
jgi:hypothetical protein